jgi:hypothetical protein
MKEFETKLDTLVDLVIELSGSRGERKVRADKGIPLVCANESRDTNRSRLNVRSLGEKVSELEEKVERMQTCRHDAKQSECCGWCS